MTARQIIEARLGHAPPPTGSDEAKRWEAVHRAPPGPDRWKFRSQTFEGVAAACAAQWGGYAAAQHMRTA